MCGHQNCTSLRWGPSGEGKWGETVGNGHLARLPRIRDLIGRSDRYNTSRTRLVYYSGSGFIEKLFQTHERGDVEPVRLDDLYG